MQIFLETERLVLRRFTEDDVDNLVELDSDPEVMRFITGGRPTPRQEIENEVLPMFLDYYERFPEYGFWAAVEKSTERFVGWFHFRPAEGTHPDELELGYRLRRSAWGKGCVRWWACRRMGQGGRRRKWRQRELNPRKMPAA